jgi:hypothetical protein
MYKRIIHHIVEEHFDHPMAVEMAESNKKTWKAPLRHYPDGEQIASDLPLSYRLGTVQNQCGNCLAFDSSNSSCKHWMLPVRAEYVCDVWTAI